MTCRKQVDESNTKIMQYNSMVYKCRDEQRQKEFKEKMAAAEAARLAKPDKQGHDRSPLSKALEEQRRKAQQATERSEVEKNNMADIADKRAAENRLERNRIDAADQAGWQRYQAEQRKRFYEELQRRRDAERRQAERNMEMLQQQRQQYEMFLSTLTSTLAARGQSYTPSRGSNPVLRSSPPAPAPRNVYAPPRPSCQQVPGGGSCGVQ
jgi:hypothetical protein